MAAASCPACSALLVARISRAGAAGAEVRCLACVACGGIRVELAVLRRRIPAPLVARLLRDSRVADRPCPTCRRSMRATAVRADVVVDVCVPCEAAWFDADELERLAALEHRDPQVGSPAPDDYGVGDFLLALLDALSLFDWWC